MILNLLVLRARDPEQLARFYEALGLRFAPECHAGGADHMACATPGVTFEIYPHAGARPTTGTRIGFAVADVDRCYAAALAASAAGLQPPVDSPWGRRAVMRDPEGHVVELTEDRALSVAA